MSASEEDSPGTVESTATAETAGPADAKSDIGATPETTPDAPRFAEVSPPDGSARAATLHLTGADNTVTSAAGPLGLGVLAAAAAWLAGCQGHCPPRVPARTRIVVFAADHGIAARGVSARAAGATRELADALASGSGPVATTAEAAGAGVRVVDVGLTGGDGEYALGHGSEPIDVADALTEADTLAAVRAGIAVADAEIDSGTDLLVAGDLGVGATTAAAALVAAMTGTEPVAVVGRGSGIDERGWAAKTAAVRDALRRAKPHLADPLALLRTTGGADIAALTGFLAQAAARRTPIVLGGLPVCAAAMLADELAPGTREWLLAASTSTEPAHELALEHLNRAPLLDLRLGGDADAGVVATLPLLTTTVRALAS